MSVGSFNEVNKSFVFRTKEIMYAKKSQKCKLKKTCVLLALFDNLLACVKKKKNSTPKEKEKYNRIIQGNKISK